MRDSMNRNVTYTISSSISQVQLRSVSSPLNHSRVLWETFKPRWFLSLLQPLPDDGNQRPSEMFPMENRGVGPAHSSLHPYLELGGHFCLTLQSLALRTIKANILQPAAEISALASQPLVFLPILTCFPSSCPHIQVSFL